MLSYAIKNLIKNYDICGSGQRPLDFVWNSDQIELFWCYIKYNNTYDYTCNRNLKD